MPGNKNFYSDDPNKTPPEIMFNPVSKFDTDKVMIWVAFSRRGISQVYIAPQRTSMDGQLYRKECLKRLYRFIDESRDQIIFWPDLATCHYAGLTLESLAENGVNHVPKDHNPPCCPQIRPIENFFGILKQKVYDGNWSAKSREQLIRRIKKCITEMDIDIIIKMFDKLEEKIQQAN